MLTRASRRQKLIVALLSQNVATRVRKLEEVVEYEEDTSAIERSSIARTLRKLESRGLVVRYGSSLETYQATLPVISIPGQITTVWIALTMEGKEAGQEVLQEHLDRRAKFHLSALDSESYARE